ncbi:squalene monooxygenase-like [Protopterus annectens]|uniref:squalene monooxygenase-like n=1 Tax=Protopterus annectens TaxID=7888 RepID=UPI001CFAE8B3|nr:squalene monooxygenase-like [Protopterus annectens]
MGLLASHPDGTTINPESSYSHHVSTLLFKNHQLDSEKTALPVKKQAMNKQEAESLEMTYSDSFSNSTAEEEPEMIVVGAGILGAAFAVTMAREGRKVLLIERDMKEPDQFAGEVLQPGGYELLKELDLGEGMEGFDACPVNGYKVEDLKYKDTITLPLPMSENKLQKNGRSFLHGRFAYSLRKIAMKEPNIKIIEGSVTRLLEEDGYVIGVLYKEKDTGNVKEVHAPLTLVADGLFSNLRKCLISRKPTVTSHFTGIILKTPPEWKSTSLELMLFDTLIVFFYQLSSTETRVMINIKGDLPRNMRDYLMQNVYHRVPEVLKEPFVIAVQNDRLKTMPARYFPAVAVDKPGVLIMGEAYNGRHPLTGGGMSIILNDIKMWRTFLKDIPDLYDDEKIFQAKQKFYRLRKDSCTFVVNVLAEVLHGLFTASDEILLRLRRALFYYCNQSTECAMGPTLLLAVLSTKPMTLIRILVTVILYAMYLAVKLEPWYAKPRGIYKSAVILYQSVAILIPLIYKEIMNLPY